MTNKNPTSEENLPEDDANEEDPKVDLIIRPGEVWSLTTFRRRITMTDKTLKKWKSAGFTVYRPGTKQKFVKTDDVIAYIDRFPEGSN